MLIHNLFQSDMANRAEKRNLSLVGQPKLVRRMKTTKSSRYGDFTEEIRSQLVLAIPSDTFESKAAAEYVCEEAIVAEINRIHREVHELEVVGRVGDLVVRERCTGKFLAKLEAIYRNVFRRKLCWILQHLQR